MNGWPIFLLGIACGVVLTLVVLVTLYFWDDPSGD